MFFLGKFSHCLNKTKKKKNQCAHYTPNGFMGGNILKLAIFGGKKVKSYQS
jgi:hypothetical protein